MLTNDKIAVFTDSACDIAPATLQEWGVNYESLTFRFSDSEVEYTNHSMPTKDFYQKMRDGGVAKTAAANTEQFATAFEGALKEGKDVLYLGFSSGLSTTYNSARIAAEELREKYPERKIFTIDTLCASAGEGLLLYLTLLEIKNGATIEQAADFAKSNKLNLCHWFTVDDLVYLKRGGRVSAATALVGNLLGIKPVLHVDNEGHLVNVTKARGRRNAIAAMAAKYKETALRPAGGHVFISHGDCEADAKLLADMLREQNGVEVEIITDVGPVIGAHSGPGTLALFFLGSER